MKHCIILGGGISGLAAAWYLRQKYQDQLQITLIEKEQQAGGHIRSIWQDDFLIELGPHSCRAASVHTLQLIQELGIAEQMLCAAPTNKNRYIWYQDCLHPLPQSLWQALTSPLLKGLKRRILTELFSAKQEIEDETIYAFITRHFGCQLAERLIDPLVAGIYAGDIHKLSVNACFPKWKELERTHGSLVKGILFSKKENNKNSAKTIFSFKEGMGYLPKILADRLASSIQCSVEVKAIHHQPTNGKISVETSQGIMTADVLISALPAYALAALLPKNQRVKSELEQIHYAPLSVVNCGYKQSVLNQQGFGYLVPSKSNQSLLGMIWASSVFPDHYPANHDCIRVMLGGDRGRSQIEVKEAALKALSDHMQISIQPNHLHISHFPKAIPQFTVGHFQRIEGIQHQLRESYPNLVCIGSGFTGVSIEDCIQAAKEAADIDSMQ